MPFIPHTPESLIPRSDSKNPATTCKGITDKGRPCRRALALKTRLGKANGVLAVAPVEDDDGAGTDAAAFFCWQHKDQAERLVQKSNAEKSNNTGATKIVPLQERPSLDTLMERLGILEEEEETPKKPSEKRRQNGKPTSRRPHRPPTWNEVEGPIMTVPRKTLLQDERLDSIQNPHRQSKDRRPRKAKPNFWEVFCCGASLSDDDYVEVIRHKKRKEQGANRSTRPAATQSHMVRRESIQMPSPGSVTQARRQSAQPNHMQSFDFARPPSPKQPGFQTSNFLSVIPKSLSPQVTSQLLTELSKPISSFDEEGYIYMFQLNSPSLSNPSTPSKAASRLLAADTPPHSRPRRPSTGVRHFSDASQLSAQIETGHEKGKLLLKIGRASNVQRRMNEWTRQCNYNLDLVRWYPHIPSSSHSSSPVPSPGPSSRSPKSARRVSDVSTGRGTQVTKIPHSHRVERLIHIELADRRVKRNCEVCGKEHREWFEIEAGREGVKAVDELVRRWVRWDVDSKEA
ncbi:MAG: hypothetical protein M1820_009584 [Bogoriella megaspora]|nr:MAG: hypothetical protein M1820_009584 [Bogoriella megaspora]